MSEELSKRDGPKSGDIGQIDEENISEDGESANDTRFSDKQDILSEELIQDQLRMSGLEFGRLSGGLLHSRSENDAEWERTDVLSEQREIGVKLEMENERWLERTNRSDLEHTETSPDSISSDSDHSPLLTPPHSQHLAVPDSPSPPSSHHALTDHHSPLPQTIDSSHFDSHSTSPRPLSPALHTPSPSQHNQDEQDGPGEADKERQVNKSNGQSEIEEGDEMDDNFVHRACVLLTQPALSSPCLTKPLSLWFFFHQLDSSITELLINISSEGVVEISLCAFTSDGGIHSAPLVRSSSASLLVMDTSVSNMAFADHSGFEFDGGSVKLLPARDLHSVLIANVTTTGDGAVLIRRLIKVSSRRSRKAVRSTTQSVLDPTGVVTEQSILFIPETSTDPVTPSILIWIQLSEERSILS
ncbi:hypothetical protein BLNAU_3333 [Blattamonas nauphoetae]|uniref:Uncharacterized protein n=1 Tax=Blattamonas nauphoetae TaxID=2049346 RepID=A0ABQ9YE24_9EUKA|nr:hypothetical protein BLNAU_3333 [Blattamonas nauphoetae]